MSEIAKCWWCKGAQLWVDQTSIIPPQHQVTCDGCDAYGPNADTRENAIAAWNTGPEPVAILRAILVLAETGDNLALVRKVCETAIVYVEELYR